MVVIIRIEVDDTTRRAIRRSMGQPGLATRAEVASVVETAFETSIVDIVDEERERNAPRVIRDRDSVSDVEVLRKRNARKESGRG